jgi:hypothetical protein
MRSCVLPKEVAGILPARDLYGRKCWLGHRLPLSLRAFRGVSQARVAPEHGQAHPGYGLSSWGMGTHAEARPMLVGFTGSHRTPQADRADFGIGPSSGMNTSLT